jgi:calcineurin-like phosphoesterase family protein
MSRKATFFTSDWHIGHANAIQFDNRPFKDVNHMHEVLIANYNNTVPDDGLCYFLGDIGLSSSDSTRKVIERLNGIKILVLGNHDKQHNAMYGCGFDVVMNGAVLWIGGKKVTMSHCPLKGVFRENLDHLPEHKKTKPPENWHGESREKSEQYTFSDEGQFHLHGHIHSRKDTPHKKTYDGRQMDVGVPAHGYRPVHIGMVESWIARHGKV